jgi:hypothetical protein
MNDIKIVFCLIVVLAFLTSCSDVGFSRAATQKSESTGTNQINPDPDYTPGDDIGDAADNPQKFVQICKDPDLHAMATGMSAGANISNVYGIIIVKAADLGKIDHAGGDIIVLGDGSGNIDSISSSYGNFIICDMSVTVANTFQGNLVVVNGSVGGIADSIGNFIVINGSMGSTTNVEGNIVTVTVP